jgi:ribonucleoside-triphosphate reductase (thioredoxin)
MDFGTKSYYSNAVQRPVLNIRDSDRFKLAPEFLAKFEGQEPEWGPVGKFTFKRTYARPLSEDNLETEEFWQCLERIVNGVYTVQKAHCLRLNLPWLDSKAQRSAQIMFELMWDFKFLPGGRGLWMMGTDYVEKHGSAALNNCLGYNTEIITADGIKKIGDCAGTVQTLLTRGGKWVDAPVRSFGHQKLMRVTLRRQGAEKEIYATPDHRWFAKDRRQAHRDKGHSEFTTENLRPEVHRLQYVFGQGIKNVKPSAFGIAHGIAFGDGTTIPGERNANCLYLCGEKDEQLAKFFSHCAVTDAPEVSDGGAIRVAGIPNSFRELPSIRENKAFLFGWLAGYLAADGNVSKQGQVSLSSSIRENILFVKDVCAVLGVGSYSISEQTRESNLTGRESTMYRLTLMRDTLSEKFFLVDEHRRNFAANSDASSRYWTVSDVQKTNAVEEVFCATVDGYGAFALADNILTGNCAFVSTNEIDLAFAEPFCYLMDFSMLGVGVGSDCRGAGKVVIQRPVQGDDVHVVADTREGWVDLLFRILEAYVGNGSLPKSIDYSKVRPYGALIKGFGGTASGPDPLIRLIEEVQRILNALIDQPITSEAIVDLCDLVGVCVVAGNVRRTAIIMFGEKDDTEFLNLKNPKVNSEAMKSHRWASNNSIFADVGMDYTETAAIAAKAGEPGYMWMDNARKYGRMGELREDSRVLGFNPCAEISLESNELCNLVETFPSRHASYEEFERTLKFAYLYAKTVSLIPTHNPKTNMVTLRNRRIGVSQSGIVQSFKRHGRRRHFEWCDRGYNYIQKTDRLYSEWLCIRKSIKTTTVKPAGTTSLLPGVTPGIHYEHAEYYFRTVRIAAHSPLVEEYRNAGYRVEQDVYDKSGRTSVIYFPIKAELFERGKSDVSIWEQMENAAKLQKYWSDNSVSITVSFKPEEGDDVQRCLELYESRLKTVSFLPLNDHGYEQAPYITIDVDTYKEAAAKLSSTSFTGIGHDIDATPKYCDGDQCTVSFGSTEQALP